MSTAKRETKTAVPRLRFPEFRDDRGWITRNLGDVAVFSSGGTPSKAEPDYWNGDIPWISASSMYETSIADSDLKVTSLAIGRGTRLAPKGSLLILVRGSMLFNRVPMGIAAVDVAFNQDVKALSVSSEVDAAFLLNQLLAISPRISINETGIGAGKIETDVLTNLPIFVPETAEQQKIADCLTSLDEVIAAQGRKVEALKAHKRGLMQQLFPREGETRPRLRFPEFRNAPEWHAEKLKVLLAIPATYGIVKAGDFQSEGIPMLRGGDIKDGCVGAGLPLVTEEIHAQYKRTKLKANDVVIALVGYPGEAAVIPDRYVGANISRAVGLLRVKALLRADYLVGFLNSPVGRRTVLKPSAGSAQVVVNLGQLNDLMIPVPSPAEQQRIADCLSSLDTRIAAETRQLAALKTHKQGLMQQLFPAPEATGA